MEHDPQLYDADIERLKRRILRHEPKKDLIAFYGSSSIRLWVHLKEDLSPLNVLNLGFGGSSYAWCIHYFQELFEGFEPCAIALYAGDNDLGNGVNAMEVVKRFQSLKDLIFQRFPQIQLHVFSIKPSPARDSLIPAIKSVNKMVYELTEADSRCQYVNVYDTLLSEGFHPNTSYYLSDELHLNRRGYLQWKRVVRDHFDLPED